MQREDADPSRFWPFTSQKDILLSFFCASTDFSVLFFFLYRFGCDPHFFAVEISVTLFAF